jgi:hypothetical protein
MFACKDRDYLAPTKGEACLGQTLKLFRAILSYKKKFFNNGPWTSKYFLRNI